MPDTPYLPSLGAAPEQVPEALEWARYLARTFGTSGALDALRYYESLGWISDGVRAELTRYLAGLSMDELHNKKYDEPGTPGGALSSLDGTPFGAHAESLRYVARLAGDEADLERAHHRAQLARQEADGASDPTPVAVADGGDR